MPAMRLDEVDKFLVRCAFILFNEIMFIRFLSK